jgi:hypothetical protein
MAFPPVYEPDKQPRREWWLSLAAPTAAVNEKNFQKSEKIVSVFGRQGPLYL